MSKVKSAKFILAAYSCGSESKIHTEDSNPTTQTNPNEVRNKLKERLQWQAYHFFPIKFPVKFKQIYITIWMNRHMFFCNKMAEVLISYKTESEVQSNILLTPF